MQKQIVRLISTLLTLLLLLQVAYSQTTGGLGARIEIDANSKFPYIYEVIKGMPADQMNLVPNDFITKINGNSTYNFSLDQVTSLLRGTVGTSCNITVWRNNKEYAFSFTRATLPIEKVTINPSCYSNAHNWVITKIERLSNKTLVHFNAYAATAEKFFFHPSMYIENYNNNYSQKLYVKSATNANLNQWYTLNAKTGYDFVLEFDKIPDDWTEINIIEPTSTNSIAWYWKYISLNIPPDKRLKIDRFINKALGFLGGAAHPFDTHLGSRYSINYNEALVTLYFNDGYYTHLRIKTEYNFLTISPEDARDYNCDLCPAFGGLFLLKEAVLKQDNAGEKSKFERYIGKLLNDMNGYEVASLILTLMWWSYD
jgi:hypothetical protein